MPVVFAEPAVQQKNRFDPRPLYKLGIAASVVQREIIAGLLRYRSYFSGLIATRIREIYLDLSFHKNAFTRLHKKKWKIKLAALTELYKLDIEADPLILSQLAKHQNMYVREYAGLSLIKFAKNDPLEFLHGLNEPISKWQQLEIFLLFQQRQDLRLSLPQRLICMDKEPSVVMLCLKLAVHFNQQEAVPAMLDILGTPDLELRAEAIASLGKLGSPDTGRYLSAIYPEQPAVIKLKILAALGDLQSSEHLHFLEREFISSTDFDIKLYAADALVKISPPSPAMIYRLTAGSEVNRSILNHSLDPLINAL